jgi:hypothetical protein
MGYVMMPDRVVVCACLSVKAQQRGFRSGMAFEECHSAGGARDLVRLVAFEHCASMPRIGMRLSISKRKK